MAKQAKGELVIVGFNYDTLETTVAEIIRSRADRIRETVKRTLESIIEVGTELLTVKETLPHGQFRAWLKGEFGWSERMARNFMSVAVQFGKSANFADLPAHSTDNRSLPSGTLDNARLALLADALEDAGCDDPDIFTHCRQPGEHVQGCWVLDRILGKE